MNLLPYFEKGVDYNSYKAQFESDIQEGAKYSEYTQMNERRLKRIEKSIHLSEEQKAELSQFPNDFQVIIITEVWCGDAGQLVPFFQKIYNFMKVPVRYVYRDQNNDLMEKYLTNGSASIPILVAMDEIGKEIFRFGPRPKKAMNMLAMHKENPEVYSKEEFQMDLQKFYNQDKGLSTYNELKVLMQENLQS